MPRLLLVVDEFAMLAKDYPDVLKSLVSVAAVGRTLGVHMILATQRPAGVVNEDILANTNLRVALRVQSRDDSNNVIGVPDAAAHRPYAVGPRVRQARPGRHHPRPDGAGHRARRDADVAARRPAPGALRRTTSSARPARPSGDDEATDLDLLIDAIVEANARAGLSPPRGRSGPSRSGTRVPLTVAGEQPVEGHGRRRRPGAAASRGRDRASPTTRAASCSCPSAGTSTAATCWSSASPAAAPPRRCRRSRSPSPTTYAPEDLDLLVLDLGTRELAPLGDLPHTAAYVGAGSGTREQQVRFLKLHPRRARPAPFRAGPAPARWSS